MNAAGKADPKTARLLVRLLARSQADALFVDLAAARGFGDATHPKKARL